MRPESKGIGLTNAEIFSLLSPIIESSQKFALEETLKCIFGKLGEELADFKHTLVVKIFGASEDFIVELDSLCRRR